MEGSVTAERRAEWKQWVETEIGGDTRTVDVALETVLSMLAAGRTSEDAMAAGRAAARAPVTEDAPTEQRHPTSDSTHLRGQVSLKRERNELMGQSYGSVWNFRVDSWDADGAPQPPVAVEVRGTEIEGSVQDGDWVEIPGPWKAGQTLHPKAFRNLTMNSAVAPSGGGTSHAPRARKALATSSKIVFGLITLAILTVIGFVFFYVLDTIL
jgi:hypothetical protein